MAVVKKPANLGGSCIPELETLMKEIARASYDLRTTGQGMGLFSDRGLLEVLAIEGPMTMSNLARRRSVSRQYIQKIASKPIREKWITLEPNPADRRAPLMTITTDGLRRVRTRRRQLKTALRVVSQHFDAEDVAKATATVSLVRSVLDKMMLAGATDAKKLRPRRQ
jgi:DNA-binding MarR family transcriptional regulator